MMVGEHDWYLDMGEKWRELFGAPTYSFDHKGVHFVVLNSVVEKDFWTARKMTPEQRMQTVAGLDNGMQSRFTVGAEQRAWLEKDLAKRAGRHAAHRVLALAALQVYRDWNFWTDDADEVQAILKRFKNVTVIHGHTHQLLTNRIGNIDFHGMLSTAWPWPYAPAGHARADDPDGRPDPFDPNDGCGDGTVARPPRRPRRQGLQPLESQPGHRDRQRRTRGAKAKPRRAAAGATSDEDEPACRKARS